MLKEEIEELAERSKGRVKVVHILSHEEKEGYEHGFITGELIKKYAPEGDYSVFMCGPKAMYDFEDGEMAKLGLPQTPGEKRDVRGLSGCGEEPGLSGAPGAGVQLTVDIRGEKQTVACNAGESLLWAMERAGIGRLRASAHHCRSGECGWCHSRLVSGKYFCPKEADGRRLADEKFGWIHPCCTFPLSDMEICVYPIVR